jgi:hypothetical protein
LIELAIENFKSSPLQSSKFRCAHRPGSEQLRQAGYQVWYDEFALKLGNSLRRSIDRGLVEADYGIVILSPAFFAKAWTGIELGGLTALNAKSNKIILPVWHKVNRSDVERFSPILADKLSVSTYDGLAAVVAAIQQTVLGVPLVSIKSKQFPAVSRRNVVLAAILLVIGFGAFQLYSKTLAPQLARAKLDARPLEYTPKVFTQKAADGDLVTVKLFLIAGMNPYIHEPLRFDEPSGRTALILAADKGHIGIVDALLNSNAADN